MTTTQEAIDILSNFKAQADAQIASYTEASEGYQIALDKLNEIIETPAADYIALQQELDAEKAKSALLKSERDSLQAQIDSIVAEEPEQP